MSKERERHHERTAQLLSFCSTSAPWRARWCSTVCLVPPWGWLQHCISKSPTFRHLNKYKCGGERAVGWSRGSEFAVCACVGCRRTSWRCDLSTDGLSQRGPVVTHSLQSYTPPTSIYVNPSVCLCHVICLSCKSAKKPVCLYVCLSGKSALTLRCLSPQGMNGSFPCYY